MFHNQVQTPSPEFLAYCDAIRPAPVVTAYRAGYLAGEVARETGAGLPDALPEVIEYLYNNTGNEHYIDLVESALIESAFLDGAATAYCDQEPLTDNQIVVAYD